MKGASVVFSTFSFLFRARDGSCFIAPSSINDSFRLLPVVKHFTTSPDAYDGGAMDNNDFNNDSWLQRSDWESSTDSEVTSSEDSTGFEQNILVEVGEEEASMSDEDAWIENALGEIHNAFSTLNDVTHEDNIKSSIDSAMDDEIAMLVRCNEEPNSLLVSEGRALGPLTKEEMNDVSQLVFFHDDGFEATRFLKDAVSKIFTEHATSSPLDGILSMDRTSIASWMTKSLREEGEGKVSQHDKRVLQTLSDFGTYGTGRLIEEDLQNLYLGCVIGDASNLSSVSIKRHLDLRTPFRDAVWRDIRAHGILSPIEEERLLLVEELGRKNSELTVHGHVGAREAEQMFVDECEILDWDYRAPESTVISKSRNSTRGSSSHKLVEMTNDQNTPLRIKDGEFVFIDEESCIGCMQCVNISPTSFTMMDSGRARTYSQRNSADVVHAVDACPVSCMHRVSYQELDEYETARDTRSKKLGEEHRRGHIPLHVAGMDSDVNRRTSLYHSLKAKCVTSSSCPQKGCYDCPSYRNPGENPFFIAKQKDAQHARAQHFIENGDVDPFRKAVDL